MDKKGKWGYVNEKGAFRIKPLFDVAEDFKPAVRNGRDTVRIAKVMYEGRFGLLKSDGTYLHVPNFDYVSNFVGGTAVFSRNGEYGMISSSGVIVMSGLELLTSPDEYGLSWFRNGGRWGVCDQAGKIVFANKYSARPETTYGGLTLIEESGRFGLLSMANRQIVLETEADWIGRDDNDSDIVHYRIGKKYGSVISDGDVILPAEYDSVTGLGNGVIKVVKGDRCGLMDKSGKEVIPISMLTDQISEGYSFYQYFDESSGKQVLMAYYKGQKMTLKDLDNALYYELNKGDYVEIGSSEARRLPFWLRRHVMTEIGKEAYGEYWKSADIYKPVMEKTVLSSMKEGVPTVDSVYVVVDRKFKVLESKGLGLVEGGSLQKAFVMIDSLKIACGAWLAPLITSVNSAAISAYDKEMGTAVKNWTSMSASVRNLGFAVDGDAVAVVDVKVEDVLMQRTFVKFSRTGARKLAIAQDGILYDRKTYISDEDSKCFVTGEMLVLSVCVGPEKMYKTRLYTKAGKLITELGDIHCELILESSAHGLKMLGKDSYFYYRSEVDMNTRKYTKKDVGLDSEKLSMIHNGNYMYFFDKETGLLKCFLEDGFESVPIPALRYTDAVWDGRRIVGVSANLWDYLEETKWLYIPRVTGDPVSENINGYMLTVYPVGQDGVAVYSINPDIWTNEGIRYGYIGYDDDFFTQPIFENARNFMNGQADVQIGGEWIKVDKRSCLNIL